MTARGEKQCLVCGRVIKGKGRWRYCSDACAAVARLRRDGTTHLATIEELLHAGFRVYCPLCREVYATAESRTCDCPIPLADLAVGMVPGIHYPARARAGLWNRKEA